MSTLQATMKRAAFARHLGVDKSYITRLAQAGRLVLTEDGKLVKVPESLAKLKDTEDPSKDGVRERFVELRTPEQLALGAGTDMTASGAPQGGPPPAGSSMSEARRELIQEQVAKARLQREELEGRLVDAETVRRATFEKARIARNALFGLVDVISPGLAAESNAAKVHDMLTAAIRRICEELAAGETAATRQ